MTPEDIVALVARAELDGIEWAGDVHVPAGDMAAARHVSTLTREAGILLPSYGSYYRAGDPDLAKESFQPVLDTAAELGVKTIRVWAGTQGSDGVSEEYRNMVTDDLCRIGLLAKEAGMTVSCEYHCNTLTDTTESALQVAEKTAGSNVRMYWQPPNRCSFDYCREGLKVILPFLSNVHMFSWEFTETEIIRLPLVEGAGWWKEYLGIISQAVPGNWAFLEFVADDSPEQFLADAGTLKRWLKGSTDAADGN
jgi:sugar phosphate isomerase/epimerase